MPPAIPTATYRLQLSGAFGFDAAAALVPYLKSLGVSHLYASPFLKARKGSTHGYDITDHSRLNPEFGGDDAFIALSDALAAADIGLILDFVPNHMGVGHDDNAWWLDVLEWGPKSPHADSFDIDWQGLPNRRDAGILLPILGKPYSEVLEQGEIELKFDPAEGSFSAWYFDHRLPIRPQRYTEMIRIIVGAAGAESEDAGRALLALIRKYGAPSDPDFEEAPAFKASLAEIGGAAVVIARGLHAYKVSTTLHWLLERQWYRLAHWRVAVSDINYRRFFDVSDLAGIRVENWKTFRAAHHLVAALIADGRLHGLRLDHIDGLADPIQYGRRLQRLARRSRKQPGRTPFYIVAEKILAEGERMPPLPGIAGLTGYEALNDITRVLLDPAGMPALDETWRETSGITAGFDTILRAAKLHVIESIMASEFMVLVRLLARIAAGHFPTRDFTLDRLRTALMLYVVHFPVYRTYITGGAVSDEDRALIGDVVEKARAEWTGPDAVIFDFVRDALTLDLVAPGRTGYAKPRVELFALKMQQFNGPVMAKSLEDTAFYRYHRLLALNEVGGDPALPGLTASDFHRRMATRSADMPHGLTGTATHDTKRGEDARMRILALSELANDWTAAVKQWTALNAHARTRPGMPSPAHEYMLYQAMIGAWPLGGVDDGFIARMQAYAVKAAREGKQQTSWINPNEDYEQALTGFVERVLSPDRFTESFSRFAQRTALIGALNSLSQPVLKAAMPGVPDIYQGTEFWDLSLVDPDNRRPVDFASRHAALDTGQSPDWLALAQTWQDGRIKLALTHRLLTLRRERAAVFTEGRYEPVAVTGRDAARVIAFARVSGREAVIVAAARHFAAATGGGHTWPTAPCDAALDLAGFRDVTDLLGTGEGLFARLPAGVWHARRR